MTRASVSFISRFLIIFHLLTNTPSHLLKLSSALLSPFCEFFFFFSFLARFATVHSMLANIFGPQFWELVRVVSRGVDELVAQGGSVQSMEGPGVWCSSDTNRAARTSRNLWHARVSKWGHQVMHCRRG